MMIRIKSEDPDGPVTIVKLTEDAVYIDSIEGQKYGSQFIADNHGNFYSYVGAKFVHGPHNIILKHIVKTKGKWAVRNKGAAYGAIGLHRVLITKDNTDVILNPYSSNVSQTIIASTKRLATDLDRKWSRDDWWCNQAHVEQFK